jgi:hypothetical protein
LSTTLIIVAIVAVIVIAAVVLSLRRKAAPGEFPESAEGVSAPPREPAPPQAVETERPRGQAVSEVPAGAPAVAVAEAESRAEEAEVGAEAEKAEAEPEPVEAAAEPAVAEDLSARVEAQIEDSERMLGELREVAGAATEGAAPRVDAGTLDIMTEGLQEVRALAKKKDWGQAKDKSQALHAQISLLLQTARRQ